MTSQDAKTNSKHIIIIIIMKNDIRRKILIFWISGFPNKFYDCMLRGIKRPSHSVFTFCTSGSYCKQLIVCMLDCV